MIFIGDIALPSINTINYKFPDFFLNKPVIANLEGSVVTNAEKYLTSNKVVNDVNAISKICNEINVHFSICNNHILDNNNFAETKGNCLNYNLSVFGGGVDKHEASKPLILEKEKTIVFTFGWKIIECIYAKKNKAGINPMINSHVFSEIKSMKLKFPGYKLFVFFHWNYELEKYPMPSQRALSHKLIEMGVDLIVGAHPHRVQGFEIYKGIPIIYSLGNFLFAQNKYRKGRLKFPEFCNLEMAFEFVSSGNHLCHFFEYKPITQSLCYLKTEKLLNSNMLKDLSEFNQVPINEYDIWFKKHRYHKKLIPVYNINDSEITILIKDLFNYLRTFAINFLANQNLMRIIKKYV